LTGAHAALAWRERRSRMLAAAGAGRRGAGGHGRADRGRGTMWSVSHRSDLLQSGWTIASYAAWHISRSWAAAAGCSHR
jgi:hypothetical protein